MNIWFGSFVRLTIFCFDLNYKFWNRMACKPSKMFFVGNAETGFLCSPLFFFQFTFRNEWLSSSASLRAFRKGFSAADRERRSHVHLLVSSVRHECLFYSIHVSICFAPGVSHTKSLNWERREWIKAKAGTQSQNISYKLSFRPDDNNDKKFCDADDGVVRCPYERIHILTYYYRINFTFLFPFNLCSSLVCCSYWHKSPFNWPQENGRLFTAICFYLRTMFPHPGIYWWFCYVNCTPFSILSTVIHGDRIQKSKANGIHWRRERNFHTSEGKHYYFCVPFISIWILPPLVFWTVCVARPLCSHIFLPRILLIAFHVCLINW